MVAVMVTYEVQVTRGERWWLIRVPAIRAAVSQARRLSDVEAMTRDLVSLMLEVPQDSFGLDVHVQLPGSVQAHLSAAERLRDEAESARALARAESQAAVRELADAGLTVRDIGEVLGVSFQRAAQLANAS